MTLLDKLALLEPALSNRGLVPVLSHYWFRGSSVMAFNDQIALRIAHKTDFACAVPGKLLLDLMRSLPETTEVQMDLVKDTLKVKAGKSKFELPTLDKSAFLFDFASLPKHKDEVELSDYLDKHGKALIEGIKDCLQSVGENVAIPDQLGVTFIMDKDSLRLYASNDVTMTRVTLPPVSKNEKPRRVTAPTAFCQQLVSLTDDLAGDALFINEAFVLAELRKAALFGRAVEVANPQDFDHTFERHVSEKRLKEAIDMPDFDAALTRAVLITDSPTDPTKTDMDVQDGVLYLDSKSPYGEVHDQVKLKGKHPEVQVRVTPKHIKNGLARKFDRLLMTERCVIMARDGAAFLVATHS